MTTPAHIAIADHTGNGDVILVTRDQYDSISETASILADQQMMNAIRQSEIDIANGNTITNDALRAKLGL
jgi:PHD/YefM family antitoxin component YafN of YafNO toxin-antitoxin module